MEYTNVPSSQILPVTGFCPIKEYSEIYSYFENYFYKLGPDFLKAFKISTALTAKNSNLDFIEMLNVLETSIKEFNKNQKSPSSDNVTLTDSFTIIKKIINIFETNNIKLDKLLFSSTLIGYLLTKLR